jgi:membrane-associated phospholipid phosphatase
MIPNPAQSAKAAWICCPDYRCWSAFVVWGGSLMLEWVVVYGGADWITELHAYRIELQMSLDRQIPFGPEMAIVYLSLFPMLWLSPFILQTPMRMKSFARALAVLIAVSGIGFLMLPTEPIRVSVVSNGVAGKIFRFADWINLTHNNFPSLHVGMAVLCAIYYSQSAPSIAIILVWLWALSIALSTLYTHQHYLLDVVAGIVLGQIVATLNASTIAQGAVRNSANNGMSS